MEQVLLIPQLPQFPDRREECVVKVHVLQLATSKHMQVEKPCEASGLEQSHVSTTSNDDPSSRG